MAPKTILGLSFGFHDSAAALLRDGEIVAASQEERFSRVKNDAGFPFCAAEFCLRQAGIDAEDLDAISYYENPMLKFDRIVKNWIARYPGSDTVFNSTLRRWFDENRFDIKSAIAGWLKVERDKIHLLTHHQSHAASAFFPSSFSEAAVLTIDGVGEYETATMWRGAGNKLEQLHSTELPNSIGLFYSAFTAFLGFPVNEGEYKVMGMAAFGEPVFADQIRGFYSIDEAGNFHLDQTLFDFSGFSDLPFTDAMEEVFGSARKQGAPFGLTADSLPSELAEDQQSSVIVQSQHYANIAASVQLCTEEIVLTLGKIACRLADSDNLCLAGGVALNSLANGRLIREQTRNLYIQPAAGDAGNALGAALSFWHEQGGERTAAQYASNFGREFTNEEIRNAVDDSGLQIDAEFDDESQWLDRVAELLSQNKVIGWVNGRSEWGPRALGFRSILANPQNVEMQRIVNEKVKFREPFRPFAPAVLSESASEYFDFSPAVGEQAFNAPEAFMLAVHSVREEQKDAIPATVHADGSARVQCIYEETHPVFYGLIKRVGLRTGVPVLLNTSFNLNGEPIVDSPEDACRTFSLCGLDYLCMGNLIVKNTLAEKL